MGNVETAVAKYIFLDIVKYSKNRSVEAQTHIIGVLNDLVTKSLDYFKIVSKDRILLPTGDGLCICIINGKYEYDIHVSIALKILENLNAYNNITIDEMRKMNIRIGVNQNLDNIVQDINKRRNIAGSGINFAQRIMSCAGENQILIGESVFHELSVREKYLDTFVNLIRK